MSAITPPRSSTVPWSVSAGRTSVALVRMVSVVTMVSLGAMAAPVRTCRAEKRSAFRRFAARVACPSVGALGPDEAGGPLRHRGGRRCACRPYSTPRDTARPRNTDGPAIQVAPDPAPHAIGCGLHRQVSNHEVMQSVIRRGGLHFCRGFRRLGTRSGAGCGGSNTRSSRRGNSRMSFKPNWARNCGVVPHSVGRPGVSLRPLGATRPASSKASSVCCDRRCRGYPRPRPASPAGGRR